MAPSTNFSYIGLLFFFVPDHLLAVFGIQDPAVVGLGTGLLRILGVSGLFVSAALHLDRLAGAAAARHLFRDPADRALQPIHIWLAILAGHVTRFTLSFLRFEQGKWRDIAVDIKPAMTAAPAENESIR